MCNIKLRCDRECLIGEIKSFLCDIWIIVEICICCVVNFELLYGYLKLLIIIIMCVKCLFYLSCRF